MKGDYCNGKSISNYTNALKMPVTRERRENSSRSPLSDDLSLQGDKIKLESRPVSREASTASAKCAYLLQGPLRSARPVSAIPLLPLYENKIFHTPKRPYSAEGLKGMSSNVDKPELVRLNSALLNKFTNSCSSLQSIEEIDKDFVTSLPSTSLLKTLLDEPVPIWQGGREQIYTPDSFHPGMDMDPCCSKDNSRISSENITNDKELRSELTPGLTSKPPRPPVKDEIKRPATDPLSESEAKSKNSATARKSSREAGITSAEAKTNIYLMDLLDISDSPNEGTANLKDSDNQPNIFHNNGDNIQENLNISDNEKMYQELLEKLDQEQQEDVRRFRLFEDQPSCSTAQLKMPHSSSTTKTDIVQLFGHNNVIPIDKSKPSTLDLLTDTKTLKKTKKESLPPKRKPALLATKQNIRHSKGKFVAKPMKLQKDFDEEEKGVLHETESWMSSNPTATPSFSQNLKDDTLADVQDVGLKDSSSTLLSSISIDNLENFKDRTEVECEDPHGASTSSLSRNLLESGRTSEAGHNNDNDNALQEEGDLVSNSSDVDQIMDVLEQETQRSHLQIQTIKDIVSKELNATINTIRPTLPFSVETTETNRGLQKVGKFTIYKPQRTSCKDKDKDNHTLQAALYNEMTFYDREYRQKSNFQDILHFLDEVDRGHTESITKAKQCVDMSNQLIANLMHLELVPKLEDLLKHTPNELALLIIELHACLTDKSSSIKLLHEEIADLREENIRAPLQLEKTMKEKLKAQKSDLDTAIRRHQKFIDQLVADKQKLSDQCEGLLLEMKTHDERYASNIRAMEHKHAVELKKAKEMRICAEKARRERWIDTKTQKIKELTVKSIEPELHAMAERHEQELSRVRRNFQREIEEMSLNHARKSEHQMTTMRAEYVKEREQALIQERDHQRDMYKAMMDEQEQNYQDERKRMFREQQLRIKECEAREQAAYGERDAVIAQAKKDCLSRVDMVETKHKQELILIREQSDFELEQFKLTFTKQMSLEKLEEERALREELKRERDQEIEAVIERFEKEAQEAKLQAEEEADRRVQFAKGGSLFELNELRQSEQYFKEKYNEYKELVNECNEKILTLTSNIQQLQYVATVYQGKLDEQEVANTKIREEMQNEIVSMGLQIESMKVEKQQEVNEVYTRVRAAIAHKDQLLTDLQRERSVLKDRITYLETTLENLRKQN